jgi:hypothetical protein
MNTTTRKTIQYEIRTIDQYGDAIDNPYCEYGKGAKARIFKIWDTLTPDGVDPVALVLERVTVYGCESEGVEDMDYDTVAVKGDQSALTAGGWAGSSWRRAAGVT